MIRKTILGAIKKRVGMPLPYVGKTAPKDALHVAALSLSEPLQKIYAFAEASLSGSGPTAELRRKLSDTLGEAAIIELAMTVAKQLQHPLAKGGRYERNISS